MSDKFDDDYNEFFGILKKIIKKYFGLDQDDFDINLIKVEGNFDEKKLQNYFKKMNLSKHSQFKRLNPSMDRQTIDVSTLSLQPNYERGDRLAKDPYFEKFFYEDSAEIIIEAPGIEKGHILLSLTEDGRTLRVSIEINFNNIEREILLPFESTMDDHILEFNNGIVTIIIHKKNI